MPGTTITAERVPGYPSPIGSFGGSLPNLQGSCARRVASGLRILSSAYSAVRADNGICGRHDVIQRPIPACADFEAAVPLRSR